MALIDCPECKNKVSDSAMCCPNCGAREYPDSLYPCDECGESISPKAPFCPHCGYQQLEMRVLESKSSSFFWIMLLLFIIGGIGFSCFSKKLISTVSDSKGKVNVESLQKMIEKEIDRKK
ncbi:zinc ribbon domain-containing protein [Candidatus Riflebacteria bacterium]